MGIRISKNICYLLSAEKINSILVPNYQEILDDLDYDDNKSKQYFNQLSELCDKMLAQKDDPFHDIYTALELRSVAKEYYDKKINIYDLIFTNDMDEDNPALCFQTPQMHKAKRYDDLIDYYENRAMESYVKYLHEPIYPDLGYIYLGGLEDISAISINHNLKIGSSVIEHVSTIAYKLNHLKYGDKYPCNSSHDVAELLTMDKYFHPTITPFVYFIAKEAEILQEHVTELILNTALEPVITQSWL